MSIQTEEDVCYFLSLPLYFENAFVENVNVVVFAGLMKIDL